MGPKKRLRFSERKKMRSNRARAEVPQGPAYLHAPIRLAAPADDPAGRFPYLRLAAQFFRSGQFCDVGLVCGVDREAVRCQGVVLAALSGFLCRALGSAPDSGGEDAVLHLPDFDAQSVVAFLDTVYGKMEAGGDLGEEDLMPHADLVQALRIGVQEDQKPALEAVAVEYERVDVPPEKDHEEEGLAEGEEEEPREEEEFLPKVEVEDHDYDYEYDPEELKSDPEPVEVKKRKPAARRARATKRKKAGGDEGVPAKKAPIKSAAPAQFLSAKVEEIESKLKPGGVGGTLEVDVSEEPFNKTRHVPASAAFAAFLGVRRGTEDGRLTGVPLIWSTEGQLHESERFSQYEAYWKCLRAVFGFSQADAHHHHLIQAKMGLRGKRLFGVRAKSHLRNDWATHTTEQLKEVLEKEDVAAVVRRGEPKPKLDGVVGGNIVLTVDCQMPPEEAETVLVLVVPESGEVLGYEYQVPREGANMKKEAYRLVECLFHVWLQRMADQYIDRCDKIVQVYLDVQPLAVQHDIVMEFLEKDPDGSKRKDIVREKVCPTCGVVFPMNTSQDRFRFNNHKKKHFFESFQCDCPVTWETKSAKIFHVQLVHMKGFFKCDYCSMVGRKSGIDLHMKNLHHPTTCEHCGAILTGRHRLRDHMNSFHKEHVVEEEEELTKATRVKKRKRKVHHGTCPHCGEHFDELSRHIKRMHSERPDRPCSVCGKIFKSNNSLRCHFRNHHMPKEQLRAACHLCDARFIDNDRLRRHLHNVHIKSRHLQCRYEGCTMAYDDTGSRSNHERIKHGMTYPQAAKKGLVPPIVREKLPFNTATKASLLMARENVTGEAAASLSKDKMEAP